MKRFSQIMILLLFTASLADPCFAISSKADLSVVVKSLRSDKGSVYVELYNSGAGFPTDPKKAFKSMFIPINNKTEIHHANSSPGHGKSR